MYDEELLADLKSIIETSILAGGTVEMLFSEGAISPQEAYKRGMLRLGNITGMTPELEQQDLSSNFSENGVNREVKNRIQSFGLRYSLTLNTHDLETLALFYAAEKGVALTQTAQTAAAISTIEFSEDEKSIRGHWYPILVGGNRVRHITELTLTVDATPLVAGTDYRLAPKHGMVQFLTEQDDDVTGTVTAKAITKNDPEFMNALVPLKVPLRAGYGFIHVYDQEGNNNLIASHEAFRCSIRPATSSERAAGTEATHQFTVHVGLDVGKMYVRRSASGPAY